MREWFKENWPPMIPAGIIIVGMVIIGLKNGWS